MLVHVFSKLVTWHQHWLKQRLELCEPKPWTCCCSCSRSTQHSQPGSCTHHRLRTAWNGSLQVLPEQGPFHQSSSEPLHHDLQRCRDVAPAALWKCSASPPSLAKNFLLSDPNPVYILTALVNVLFPSLLKLFSTKPGSWAHVQPYAGGKQSREKLGLLMKRSLWTLKTSLR